MCRLEYSAKTTFANLLIDHVLTDLLAFDQVAIVGTQMRYFRTITGSGQKNPPLAIFSRVGVEYVNGLFRTVSYCFVQNMYVNRWSRACTPHPDRSSRSTRYQSFHLRIAKPMIRLSIFSLALCRPKVGPIQQTPHTHTPVNT